MDSLGMGTGLAALGFWIFVATLVAAGVWSGLRKRESQHETLRRIVESGQPLDEALTDKLLAVSGGAESKDLGRDLKVGSYTMFALAPGLALLGVFMGWGLAIELLYILLGVAALLLCLGIGFHFAANMVQKQYGDDSNGDSAA